VRIRPYRTIDNRIDGVVITFIDITEAHDATEATRASEERFATLLHATTDAAFRMGPDWSEMRMLQSGALLAHTNGPRRDWLETYIPEQERAKVRKAIEAAISQKSLFELEHRVFRNDGTPGWVLTRAAPILESDGAIREWFGIATDITARKDAEAAQTLVAELNHRVKNTMALVISIAEQTRGDATSLDAFFEAFEDRLHALSGAHDALTRSGWTGADLDGLVRDAVALVAKTSLPRVGISGPPVILGPSATTSLRLALHELSTNAVKHGALSVPEGRIAVGWEIVADQPGTTCHLAFEWRERDGPAVTAPLRPGFGARLLEEDLPRDLGGTGKLSADPEGMRYCLDVPLSHEIRNA
jgi:two-component sensor histidine kinase